MVQCSPVLNQIFGFPKDVFFKVFDANARKRHEGILAKAIEQVSSYASEYKILVKGQLKWI